MILDKKRRADPAYFEIILKPSQEATYRNTVDVLDKMAIDAIRHFALVDISQEEYTIMRSKEQ